MIASTVLLTGLGWIVTAVFVEPRFERKSAEEGGPSGVTSEDAAAKQLTSEELKGLAGAVSRRALVLPLPDGRKLVYTES